MTTKKPVRAFSPPPPRPRAMTEDEIKKMTMEKLVDPNYQPEGPVGATEGTVAASPAPLAEVASGVPLRPAESPPADVESTSQEFPWNSVEGLKKTNLLYEIPPEIVAKMNWVIDNVPRMSRQRIVRDAVAAELDRLIALYYKG